MVERSFTDPESMVGASAEQVLAMVPEGWFVRPFPDGRKGFCALDPSKLPGSVGTISYHSATPGYMTFDRRPPAPVYLLNEALDLPVLSELPRSFSASEEGVPSSRDVADLMMAGVALLRSGLVQVWRDTLSAEPAVLLKHRQADETLRAIRNWFHDEADVQASDAEAIYFLDLTGKGRRASAAGKFRLRQV